MWRRSSLDFLGRGGAVVARDGDGDVGGDERALERVDLGEDSVDDVDGVGAGAFGEAEGDGGFLVGGGAAAAAEEHVVDGLRSSVSTDRGDVAQVNGTAGGDADDDSADIAGVAEERAGL
jgi:hypothetical protein